MRYVSMLIVAATAAALSSAIHAQVATDRLEIAQAEASAPAALADGEVRKVDKEAGKITLKHGPIESLGMPPMTMVFRVKDPAMLDQVKAGDKVKFAADQSGGQMTVTRIEPQP